MSINMLKIELILGFLVLIAFALCEYIFGHILLSVACVFVVVYLIITYNLRRITLHTTFGKFNVLDANKEHAEIVKEKIVLSMSENVYP